MPAGCGKEDMGRPLTVSMIINSHIITYLVCSCLSLLIGLMALINGVGIRSRWKIDQDTEEQYLLEKRIYLIITLLSLGFFLRLLMALLWFQTLHSMIISVPGAMCLAGVHNINAPLSYIASSLKLVFPALYGYWLVLHFLDRQVVSQPFMKQKLILLAPLGILILIETVLDTTFLLSVPPRQVSCCTSLFIVPRENIPQIVTGSAWVWVLISYCLFIFTIGEIVWFVMTQKRCILSGRGWWFGKKSVMIFETLVIAFLIAVFLLALHTKIAPLFLRLPFHHCIFCLGQQVWDALLSFGLIFTGLYMLLIYFWVVSSKSYRSVNFYVGEKMVKLLKWSGCTLTGGVVVLSIHMGLVI